MKVELSTKIGNIIFKNPIWVASGTFGCGEEFQEFFNINEIGAIITKTVTLREKRGNPPPRLIETSAGLINSIGLENKGIDYFLKEHLSYLRNLRTKIIISIGGQSAEEFVECAEKLVDKYIPAGIELNLSCPNISHKGTHFDLISQDESLTEKIISSIRKKVNCLLIAKLTPNVGDIGRIAKAAERGGIDAVSLVNTYFAMAVDAKERRSLLGNIIGGLSGPAIKPMALKAVWDVHKNVKIPIIGIGGIMRGIDVAEFMLCGASAVQIGTANLIDPRAYSRILGEFKNYLKEQKIGKMSSLVGKLKG